jgi:hypothetical protein
MPEKARRPVPEDLLSTLSWDITLVGEGGLESLLRSKRTPLLTFRLSRTPEGVWFVMAAMVGVACDVRAPPQAWCRDSGLTQ